MVGIGRRVRRGAQAALPEPGRRPPPRSEPWRRRQVEQAVTDQGESIRRPSVAGRFYAGTAAQLQEEVAAAFRHRLGPGELPTVDPAGPRELVALVSPHAGYVYSGPAAAHGFAALAADGRPEIVVILGPNHQGLGLPIAVSGASAWSTPLGEVPVDVDLSRRLADASVGAKIRVWTVFVSRCRTTTVRFRT